jgi:hypothetical protein
MRVVVSHSMVAKCARSETEIGVTENIPYVHVAAIVWGSVMLSCQFRVYAWVIHG